jgi:phospholipid-binding lipoprotein MlaA
LLHDNKGFKMFHPLLIVCHLRQRLQNAAVCVFVGLVVLGGCASTGDPRDPLEAINRNIYTFNEGVDTVLIKPAAEVYQGVVPPLARTGVSNVFANMGDVVVALNNLLQGKIDKAFSDIGRVLINSTAGLFGLFDVASPAGLEKHDEDFGQTLGYWGIGDGPYLVLPLLGPSTLRDTAGRVVDFKTDPVAYIDPTRDRNAAQGLRLVSRRTELLGASRLLEVAAIDPYSFVRDAYLQRRRNLIHDGNPPRENFDAQYQTPAGNTARGVNPRPTEAGLTWRAAAQTPAADAMPSLPPQPLPVTREAESTPVAHRVIAGSPVIRVWLPQRR